MVVLPSPKIAISYAIKENDIRLFGRANMPLEVHRGGVTPPPQFNFSYKKRIGGGLFSRDNFSSEGGVILPKDSYKPFQDL